MSIVIKVLELTNVPDAQGDIMSPDAEVIFHDRVILTKDFVNDPSLALGTATLFREGDSFYIKDFKMVETFAGQWLYPLTPAIGGRKMESKGSVITKFSIDSIGFLFDRNSNPNIKTVKEQLKEKI